jgi:hypothetical protein
MTLGVGMNLDLNLTRTGLLLVGINQGMKNAELSSELGFHRSMVDSIKSWASHMGLLTDGSNLSKFGEQLLALDSTLEHPVSRLLLYYQLASNPKAEVFYYIINYPVYNAAVNNQPCDIAELRASVARATIGANSRAVKQRDKELALMLRTLYRPQAFGPLGILSSTSRQCFTVHHPLLSSAFVAFAVYSQWHGDAAYTGFDELEQAGHFARICLLTRPALVDALRIAENSGYLSVQQEAGFNRVSRVSHWNAAKLLEVLYA